MTNTLHHQSNQWLPQARRMRGFTLIELLLAISIFAIVLVAANSILFGVLRLRNRTMDRITQATDLERASTIIRRDIGGIVVPTGKLTGVLQSESDGLDSGQGKPVSPIFYTNTGLIDDRSRWAEIQKVIYYLRTPTNQVSAPGLDLVRTVTRNLLPATQEQFEDQWLLGGVEQLTFTYYDGTQWQTSWNSTNQVSVLPRAIKVELLLASENTGQKKNASQSQTSVQWVVPILVAADTNQTQIAGVR